MSDDRAEPRRSAPIVLGRKMANAHAAEGRHRAQGHGPSPLAGVEYTPSRGELDLFRFVASAVDDTVLRFLEYGHGLDQRERAALQAALTMHDFYTLLTFARRRALSTLRENDAALVAAGIDAISLIHAERIDWRDAVVATALLAYAGRRTGLDVTAVLAAGARVSGPGIEQILTRFASEPVDSLDAWGYRELSTAWGVVLLSAYWEPFAPTADLVSVAVAAAALFDRDAWRVSDMVIATRLPVVWLGAGDRAAVDTALGTIVACASISGQLTAPASREADDQGLTLWLAECSDARAAATLAAAPGPGSHDWFESLGVAAGRLCAVMISRSVVVGVESYERAGSLERFRAGLSAVLAGRRR